MHIILASYNLVPPHDKETKKSEIQIFKNLKENIQSSWDNWTYVELL
jgi:hypothetical protein